jgi:hypothetical protein
MHGIVWRLQAVDSPSKTYVINIGLLLATLTVIVAGPATITLPPMPMGSGTSPIFVFPAPF